MLSKILIALFMNMTVAHFFVLVCSKNTTKFKSEKRKTLFLFITIIPILNLFQLYAVLKRKEGLKW